MKKKLFFIILVLGIVSVNAEESMWEKVKSGADSAWDSTKEVAEDASKSDTAESIKDGTGKAWDSTKDFFSKTKDKLTED